MATFNLYTQQHLNKYSNIFKNKQCDPCKEPPTPITRTYQQTFAKQVAAVLLKCKYDNNTIDFTVSVENGAIIPKPYTS